MAAKEEHKHIFTYSSQLVTIIQVLAQATKKRKKKRKKQANIHIQRICAAHATVQEISLSENKTGGMRRMKTRVDRHLGI